MGFLEANELLLDSWLVDEVGSGPNVMVLHVCRGPYSHVVS